MVVISDGEETLLNEVKLYGIKIPQTGALDINRSPYLIISYLLKDE